MSQALLLVMVAALAVSLLVWRRLFFLLLAAGASYLACLAVRDAEVMTAGLMVTNAMFLGAIAFTESGSRPRHRIPEQSSR